MLLPAKISRGMEQIIPAQELIPKIYKQFTDAIVW